jgi:hypothetical protein
MPSPLYCIQTSGSTTTVGIDFPPPGRILPTFGVDGHHNTLTPKHFGCFPDKSRVTHCGGIEGHFVGTGPQQVSDLCGACNAPANSKRHKQALGGTVHHIQQNFTPLVRGGNVQKDQLICPLGIVDLRRLYRITGVTQINKVYTLDNPPIFDVKAGNNALG